MQVVFSVDFFRRFDFAFLDLYSTYAEFYDSQQHFNDKHGIATVLKRILCVAMWLCEKSVVTKHIKHFRQKDDIKVNVIEMNALRLKWKQTQKLKIDRKVIIISEDSNA